MSSETTTAVPVRDSTTEIQSGAIGGIVASAIMAIPMLAQMSPVIEQAIPAMYGVASPAPAVGFGMHLVHGAVFGVVFAAVLSTDALGEWADGYAGSAGLGLAYGVLVWVVAAAIVMPLWLGVVGFPAAPALPNFNTTSLMGHLVFGLALGLVYPALR